MATKIVYNDDYPDGFVSVCRYIAVAGESFRLAEGVAFGKLKEHHLRIEAEPDNQHDPNAIRIYGYGVRGLIFKRKQQYLIGYAPKEVSAWIASHGVLDLIWIGIYQLDIMDNGICYTRFNMAMPETKRPNHDLYTFRN